MKTIELARKAAELGEQAGACRAYELVLRDEAGAAPEERLEAAAYVLQFGEDYKLSYTCFRELYNAGHFQEEILPIMSTAFYEPNEADLRACYGRNCKLLGKYPYLFRRDFPAFEDLPIRFFPFDDDGYIPFDRNTMLFWNYVNFNYPVVSRNFFKDLDRPVLAADVFSQYELEYLNDNVRRSEHVGRENHVYLHYTGWEVFCSYLQVLNLRPLLKEKKLVFLIEDEIGQYPIDFKERFGVDYSQYPVKPLGLREINRLIWHVQLSTHNGGDFFNEVFDGHPNLVSTWSVMLDEVEEKVAELRETLDQLKYFEKARREILRKKENGQVIRELCALQEPTDKDIFVAVYLNNKNSVGCLDPAARIVPAIFFQPHFHHIEYKLRTDQNNRAMLESEEYDKIRRSPIFQGFKYIKTFTPMRRFTTSYGASVRAMHGSAMYDAGLHKRGQAYVEGRVVVVGDEMTGRVLNRSFMIDRQDRLYQDAVVVRFEDGKLNPKATFTALAAFLDLPYTQSMTRCTENGELLNYLGYITDGFDSGPVYKTYDDYANDSERKYIEYFLRDAYEFYGYDFQYYDGRPVTMEQIREWLNDFTTIDRFIRETWGGVYEALKPGSSGSETSEQDQQQFIEETVRGFHENREKNSEFLMRGPRFVSGSGQPLHMTPLLELDPALLEQPLYH